MEYLLAALDVFSQKKILGTFVVLQKFMGGGIPQRHCYNTFTSLQIIKNLSPSKEPLLNKPSL